MKKDYSQLHIVFITETDDIAKTDEKYIRKFLKVHYKEYCDIKIHPIFINVGGNGNIIKDDVITEVARKKAEIFGKPYFEVVQCFDRDRKNKDKTKIDDLISFSNKNGYHPVIFSKNVEDCFKPTGKGSKAKKAQDYFSKYLTPNDLNIEIFRHNIDYCRKNTECSNLDLVISELVKKIE